MEPEERTVSMLELDRHLSQALEQARQSPVSVQRYGQPWVWLLSCDAWTNANRWESVDTSGHPLLAVRDAVEPLLEPWMAGVGRDGTSAEPLTPQAQRTLLLMHLRGIEDARRLHDGIHHNMLYRNFIGFDHGSAWSVQACAALLELMQTPRVRACIADTLARLPTDLVNSVLRRRRTRISAVGGSEPASRSSSQRAPV